MRNQAQEIGGQQRGRHIYGRLWRRMAQFCGLPRPGVIRRINAVITRRLAELLEAQAEVAAMPAGLGPMLATFAASIQDRARLVQTNAKREGDETEVPPTEPIDKGADLRRRLNISSPGDVRPPAFLRP